MTLGGLALAIGILVDEATVEVENIHSQFQHTPNIAHAVRAGNAQTAIPRLLAMLCILAVFLPSFFMQGAARALFIPLSLAVGFSMLASYVLSSTFVPVLSVWLLRHVKHSDPAFSGASWLDKLRASYTRLCQRVLPRRLILVTGYLAAAMAVIILVGGQLGTEIFPLVDAGQFRLRLRAKDGTHFAKTEQIALNVLQLIKDKAGAGNVDLTLGYVGTIPSSYPINAVYQWSRGPEEAILLVSLKPGSHVDIERLKEELRRDIAQRMPDLRCSFEPSDIVNEVMSFGSPTPIDISVSGNDVAESRKFAQRIYDQLKVVPALRDLQFAQSLDYPTVQVKVDREKAGMSGVTEGDIARSIVPVTSSSRFVLPNYWPDPKTGIGYQVQVEIPQAVTKSEQDLAVIPVKTMPDKQLLLRDVADVQAGTMAGQFDRYNMKRQVGITANIAGEDLGSVSRQIQKAVSAAGDPPKGSTVEIRGQIPPMQDMFSGLGVGLALAVVVVFLLLAANFQSFKLALVTVSTVPAVIAGVVLMLFVTRTTLNIQSFIGAIMAIGVAMANAILLVTFAENRRRDGAAASDAAVDGAAGRLRAILMTSCAMIAGMIPMALGLGEAGPQTAPLGRAVIGGLAAATVATLVALPSVFALVQSRAPRRSASLDPDDPSSEHFVERAI